MFQRKYVLPFVLALAVLPLTNALGFGSVFLAFALMGVVYFVTVLFIPETKGKTLEEIEEIWSKGK